MGVIFSEQDFQSKSPIVLMKSTIHDDNSDVMKQELSAQECHTSRPSCFTASQQSRPSSSELSLCVWGQTVGRTINPVCRLLPSANIPALVSGGAKNTDSQTATSYLWNSSLVFLLFLWPWMLMDGRFVR